MKKLMSQIAVVTGASGGVGCAIAAALAEQGATVCIVGRDHVRLEATATRIRGSSIRIHVCPTNLANDEEVERLAAQVTKEFGRLDILVHSAGMIAHGALEVAPLELLDQQFRSNVRGPLMLTQKLLPLLKKPRGQIVFINSSLGLNAKANVGHYSATQHAFKALADSLRHEVNADSVRVLSVFLGRTATPLMQAQYAKDGKPYRPELLLQPEDVSSVVLNTLTLPWTAEVMNISIRPMQKSY